MQGMQKQEVPVSKLSFSFLFSAINNNDDSNNQIEKKNKFSAVGKIQHSRGLLFTVLSYLNLTASHSFSSSSSSTSLPHSTSSPAADALADLPVKKLAVAEEDAAPKSVAAPVLDADWAYAIVGSIAGTTDTTATAADKIASIMVVFFIVLCEWINGIYVSRRTIL